VQNRRRLYPAQNGTKPPFLRTTVSVRFRINLPVAMPDGQRRRDNHCGCRAIDKIPAAEASEKHLFIVIDEAVIHPSTSG